MEHNARPSFMISKVSRDPGSQNNFVQSVLSFEEGSNKKNASGEKMENTTKICPKCETIFINRIDKFCSTCGCNLDDE